MSVIKNLFFACKGLALTLVFGFFLRANCLHATSVIPEETVPGDACYLETMPQEILCKITSYVTQTDLMNLSKASRKMSSAAMTHLPIFLETLFMPPMLLERGSCEVEKWEAHHFLQSKPEVTLFFVSLFKEQRFKREKQKLMREGYVQKHRQDPMAGTLNKAFLYDMKGYTLSLNDLLSDAQKCSLKHILFEEERPNLHPKDKDLILFHLLDHYHYYFLQTISPKQNKNMEENLLNDLMISKIIDLKEKNNYVVLTEEPVDLHDLSKRPAHILKSFHTDQRPQTTENFRPDSTIFSTRNDHTYLVKGKYNIGGGHLNVRHGSQSTNIEIRRLAKIQLCPNIRKLVIVDMDSKINVIDQSAFQDSYVGGGDIGIRSVGGEVRVRGWRGGMNRNALARPVNVYENLISLDLCGMENLRKIDNGAFKDFKKLESFTSSSFINLEEIGSNVLENAVNIASFDGSDMLNLRSIGSSFLKNAKNLRTFDGSGMITLEKIGVGFLEACRYMIVFDGSGMIHLNEVGYNFMSDVKVLRILDFSGWRSVKVIQKGFLEKIGKKIPLVGFEALNVEQRCFLVDHFPSKKILINIPKTGCCL